MKPSSWDKFVGLGPPLFTLAVAYYYAVQQPELGRRLSHLQLNNLKPGLVVDAPILPTPGVPCVYAAQQLAIEKRCRVNLTL